MKISQLPILFICLLWFSNSIAQEENKKMDVKGRMMLSHQYYNLDGENSGINPRRPNNLTRLILNPTFSWGKFSLPFTINLSSSGTNTVTPPGQFGEAYAIFNQIQSFDDLVNFVQNPINQVGVAPQIGDNFQLFLGTHTPNYSRLTQGNISIFGAGMQWQAETFFVSANYGVSQHAIQPQPNQNIAGAFKRNQYSGRFGYGQQDESFIALNFTGGSDDTGSFQNRLQNINPESGLNTSAEFQFKLFKGLFFGGEAAASLFTNNLYSSTPEQLEEELGFVNDYLDINLSSRVDGAGNGFIRYKSRLWGISANVLYVGQGYKTFGYPFFQSDRLEYTLNPNLSLWKRRINLSGTVGTRTNNLSGTKASRMDQLLLNANINAQLTDGINLNASYSNFGVQSSITNDTLRIENISQNISITPSFTLDGEIIMHVNTLIFSYDDFQDLNLVSGALNSNQSLLYGTSYQMLFKNFPLSLGANVMRFELNSSQIKIDNNTFGLNAGYKFFKSKLSTNIGVTRLINRPGANETQDHQWLLRFNSKVKLPRKFEFDLLISNNAYDYGSIRQGAQLTETMVRLGLSKRF